MLQGATQILRPKRYAGQVYPEREVNAILKRHHEDVATLRRELLGEAFFARLARIPGASVLLVLQGFGDHVLQRVHHFPSITIAGGAGTHRFPLG